MWLWQVRECEEEEEEEEEEKEEEGKKGLSKWVFWEMGCVFGKEASKKKEEVEVARAEDGVAQNSGNVKVGGEEEKILQAFER